MPAHMKLRSVYESLSATERKVADFILNHSDSVPNMVVSDIAAGSGVSVPTVIRLSRRLGYSSFLDFRVALAVSRQLGDDEYVPISQNDSDAQLIHKVFSGSMQALIETEKSLDAAQLSRFAELLCASRRVMLYGIGASCTLCRDFCSSLNYLDIVALAPTEPDMAGIHVKHLGKGDIFLGISRSGVTRHTLDALEIARKNGACCAFITNSLCSPAKELCDFFFCTSRAADQFEFGHRDGNVPHHVLLTALYLMTARRKQAETAELSENTETSENNEGISSVCPC